MIAGNVSNGVMLVANSVGGLLSVNRSTISDNRQVGKIACLTIQTSKGLDLRIRHKGTACQAGAQLANEHFLTQHLTKTQAIKTHLANNLIEAVGIELPIDLEFRRQQNQLVNGRIGECKTGIRRALQQQLPINQPLKSRLTQQLVIQQRSIKILAQLLLQLTNTIPLAALTQHGRGLHPCRRVCSLCRARGRGVIGSGFQG